MDNYFEFKINDYFDNYKLRDFFKYFKVSSSKIYKLFLEKRIYVNNELSNENQILKINDILKINITGIEEIDFPTYKKDLNIIYEDDFILIVNKPKNILVHPDNESNTKTLCNIVSNYYENNNINRNIRYPHRLDYDTTGIIIFTKIFFMQSYIDNLIFENKLDRYYHLLCCGNFNNKEGIIDLKLSKNKKLNKMVYNENGLEAITNYKLLKNYKNYALIEAKLDTGRMHQIRAHFSLIKHPLIGDNLYNTKINYNRVLLHSKKVSFFHPFLNKNIELEIDYPNDFKEYL
jgi:23S rRNA pseudouridine1911/1915/1917 synthase